MVLESPLNSRRGGFRRRRRGTTITSDTWHVLVKNARIHTEEKQIALLAELSTIDWHFACFSETRLLTNDIIL